jgi:hypothetical protein
MWTLREISPYPKYTTPRIVNRVRPHAYPEVDSMATKTYSERVNIIKYVKHADRWRFAPVVKRPNGKHSLRSQRNRRA